MVGPPRHLSQHLAAASAVALAFFTRGEPASAVVPSGSSADYSTGGSDGRRRGEELSLEASDDDSAGRSPKVTLPAELGRLLVVQAPPDEVLTVGCGLCPVRGSELRSGDVPSPRRGGWSFPFPRGGRQKWTCEEWDAHVRSHHWDGSDGCLDARDGLMRKCCDGLPPLYECTQDVLEMLGIFLTSTIDDDVEAGGGGGRRKYQKDILPIGDGDIVTVELVMEGGSIEIIDHGIGGGAVEVSGVLTMRWTDERLAWNVSEVGCTSVRVMETYIWMPGSIVLFEGDDEGLKSRPAVTADGRVSWTRKGSFIASCETVEGSAKQCDILYTKLGEEYEVKSEFRGEWKLHGLLDDEYRLDENRSGVNVSSTLHSSDDVVTQVWRFYFEPKATYCNICGHASALQPNATVRYFPESWKDEFGGDIFVGCNCTKADELLTARFHVSSPTCSKGRAALEEICCDDTVSSFECRSSIHDTIVEDLNTVTPPDPSPQENDTDFSSKDFVNVRLHLDVLHIFDIDVKLSTMSLLVAVELNWYDDRLRWDPFIGGCHRVSYRASPDAELTEIWVPEIELINQVEGIQTLPETFASARYDGRVKWRRSGVLQASCAITGVQHFPFGPTGCDLVFGATRDPLFHRVKLIAGDVEFSERVRQHSGFQEYSLMVHKTTITSSEEEMSGFSNEQIRFQFYFSRATEYYAIAFILLYILFTYLSFGMFFVDYSLGERLGYGAGILFVIVAQDITMFDKTPVTDKMLWIYRLSFGSKIFVIVGLIQSLAVLYTFSHGDYQEADVRAQEERREEARSLVHESSNIRRSLSADVETVNNQEEMSMDSNLSRVLDDGSSGDNTTQVEDRPRKCSKMNLCKPVLTNITRCCRFIGRHDLIIIEADSLAVQKLKRLRRVDWLTAMTFFLTYSAFLLIMFLGVSHY